MLRPVSVVLLAVAFLASLAGSALADRHPSWDPSVGYNPEALEAALEKARKEAEKEAPRGFAPGVAKPGAPTKSIPEAWQPYQYPHPTGN